jgi:hypothetical protein
MTLPPGARHTRPGLRGRRSDQHLLLVSARTFRARVPRGAWAIALRTWTLTDGHSTALSLSHEGIVSGGDYGDKTGDTCLPYLVPPTMQSTADTVATGGRAITCLPPLARAQPQL